MAASKEHCGISNYRVYIMQTNGLTETELRIVIGQLERQIDTKDKRIAELEQQLAKLTAERDYLQAKISSGIKMYVSETNRLGEPLHISYNELGEIHQVISMHIMNTQEKQIKEALIKLGWTPPSN